MALKFVMIMNVMLFVVGCRSRIGTIKIIYPNLGDWAGAVIGLVINIPTSELWCYVPGLNLLLVNSHNNVALCKEKDSKT